MRFRRKDNNVKEVQGQLYSRNCMSQVLEVQTPESWVLKAHERYSTDA